MNHKSRSELDWWRANWQREVEGAYLYGRLAHLARTPTVRQAVAQMAAEEQQHAALWAERIHAVDAGARTPTPDLRIHLTGLLAAWLGTEKVLGLLINDEVSDIAAYTDQAQQLGDEATYRRVLADETSHAYALAALQHPDRKDIPEPWHRGASAGGWVRNVVYGFNDGLTANFGLVMGVVGATVNNQVILLAGFAGLLADALSMAASGYLAAQSEQEVREYHLGVERTELRMMPDEERQELVHYYERMGLTQDEASGVAGRLMQNPDVALTQLAREELGIDPEARADPIQEGVITGIATGLGAIIPIVPFLLLQGTPAVAVAIVLSMVAHFAVGASRAVFTGRPALRSGFEMFVVGMGVALLTYLLGRLFGVAL